MKNNYRAPEQHPPIWTIILGGSRPDDPLSKHHNVPSKAHIQVVGRSMLGRVLEAVTSSTLTGKISVIGLENYQTLKQEEAWPDIEIEAGAETPSSSIFQVCQKAPEDAYPVFVTTCDHALLRQEIVHTFLKRSEETDADLTVGLVNRNSIEEQYPNVQRTYLKFKDGDFSSCNLFCLKGPAAMKVVEFWQSAEVDRKRPWRIARRFGVLAAARLLIRRPTLEQSFKIISSRLKVRITPVILPFATAAIDVDKTSDLELVEQILRSQDLP